MDATSLYIAVGLAVIGFTAIALGVWLRAKSQKKNARVDFVSARKRFSMQREFLEAKFETIASQSGRPRGLIWKECDFQSEVQFARDPANDQLRAFVAVTISFEAIEGGEMEEVEAVSNLRAATAVFSYVDGNWMTDGRTIFNLSPRQAIEHYRHTPETAPAPVR
ncbi:hypothetical protein LOC68_08615 [Blastopirellula sp. JC732]|uniref:Uncharacterized protein n=1 Tax=Blastopirellula sediminis TaxID=2894196 RepID=A0A9X1MLJ6_9BACT|nr:hypothetical protein [Blastopirellula sediminis]MCC9608768.1 hypothetical protein [Blastopirellula sediminis]MCC9628455.1 hypothetical protein [Blastopirellula sediminis]